MTDRVKIQISGLYKIFGPAPREAMEHVRRGVDKTGLLRDHGHVLGLRDINIEMLAGKITVIMGLSGSGKSTLIRHVNRLIDPTVGAILIDGQDVMALGPEEMRRLRQKKLSMVFQNFALLPHKTVLQNAVLAPLARGDDRNEAMGKARHWLGRVGLDGVENHYPYQLSGGMQQRVGIVRALTSDADVMLMDEAFSALDPLIRNEMQDLLLQLQAELHKTIVFITHDLDEALKIADHLVILKDGAVVQQGAPQDVLLRPADDYIERFVRDINRARVLRVGSVMREGCAGTADIAGDVRCDATLESVLALSGGDVGRRYRVLRNGEPIGVLDMRDLVRGLAPRNAAAGET